MLSRVRLAAIVLLGVILAARVSGCAMPDIVIPDFNPGPVVSPDQELWLLVIEEKSDRPEGMAAFERSEFRQSLPDKKIRYRNLNDDEGTALVEKSIEALGGKVPGYLVVKDGSGEVILSGQVPDPIPADFFAGIVKEVGR